MKMHVLDGYIQKIYLVEYPHGLLLLDGCSRADATLICDFIRTELGRPLTDLKLVCVTHMHPDHAGAAHKLRALTGCQLAGSNIEHAWYRGAGGWLMYVTDLLLTLYVAGRIGRSWRNVWYPRVLRPDIKLNDADYLPGFEEWQVINTPGHTDRDISLVHRPSQRAYVADLLVKVKGRFSPPFPVFHPNQYRASLARIRNMNLNSLWLAHVGEVSLTPKEFDHVQALAPVRPKTHWRATKLKLRQWLWRNK